MAPLIREGRTTLDAAFGTFQFAIGICFIFFIGVLMLYSVSKQTTYLILESSYLFFYPNLFVIALRFLVNPAIFNISSGILEQ